MPNYRITFEMDVEAPSMRDAAEMADDFVAETEELLERMQTDCADTSCSFGVFGPAHISWPDPA